MFGWLSRKPKPPPAPTKAPQYERTPYHGRMDRLGYFRFQVLVCTDSDNPRFPQYFNPPDTDDLHEVFRGHLEGLWDRWLPVAVGPQFNGMAVVAAGLLSYGRLEMAQYILDHLPDRLIRNGYCNTIARRVVVAVLPLPEELRRWVHWVAGTPEAEAVRSWFAQHRDVLRWQPSPGSFVMAESTA